MFALNHIVSNLKTPVRREAVHDTCIFLGYLQKITVDLVAVEIFHSLLLRSLVAHADPDICVQQIRILSRFYGIMRDINIVARSPRGLLGFPQQCRFALMDCEPGYYYVI